jgi:hypothetical protein
MDFYLKKGLLVPINSIIIDFKLMLIKDILTKAKQ